MSKTLFTFIFFIGLLFSPFVSFAQSGDVYEFTAPIFLKELPPADQYGVQYTIDRNRTILQARTLSGLTTKNALQTLIIAPKKNGISLSQNICFGVSRDIGLKNHCVMKLYNGSIDSGSISGRYIITRPLPYNDSVQMDIGAQFSKDISSYEGGETFMYHFQYASGTIVSLPINKFGKLKNMTVRNSGKNNPISVYSGVFTPCSPGICEVYKADGIRLDGTKFDALNFYKNAPQGSEMIQFPSYTATLIIYTRKL